jgi:hypothetical protein
MIGVWPPDSQMSAAEASADAIKLQAVTKGVV